MQKPFYNDILLVLILTLLSVVCLFVTDYNLFSITTPLSYIPYALILLFLPGYSMLAAENPEFIHNSLFKRVGLSIFVSLVISVFLALLLTYTPLGLLDGVIFYILGAFTIILSVIAISKRKKSHYVHFVEPEGQPGFDREILNFRLRESTVTPQLELEKTEKPIEIFDEESLRSFPQEVKTRAMNVENQAIKMDKDINPEPEKADKNLKTPPLRNQEHTEKQLENTEPPEQQSKISQPTPEETKKRKKEKKNPGPDDRPPRRFAYLDLVVVLFLAIISTVFLLMPGLNEFIIKSATDLFLMLFLPGYALIAAIYPRKDDLSAAVRLVLSFGVSYFLTSVIGLALNYTSMGNNLNPVLLILSVLTFIFIVAAFLMRIRVQKIDSFSAGSGGTPSNTKTPTSTDSSKTTKTPPVSSSKKTPSFIRSNRKVLLVGIVILATLLIAAPFAYNFMSPPEEGNSSTAFYVMDSNGNNLTTYPNNLTPGDNVTVTIVVENHENTTTDYRIVTTSNQMTINEINLTLGPDERREIPYTFTVGEPGNKKLEFFLYKLPDLNSIYRSYSFFINIIEMVTETTEGDETSTGTTEPGGTQEPYVPPYQPPYTPPEPEPEPPVYEEPILDEYQSE